jgi:hypothetical protein
MAELQIPRTLSIPEKHARILRGPHQWALDLTNKCNFIKMLFNMPLMLSHVFVRWE